jgi:hypothetical protein
MGETDAECRVEPTAGRVDRKFFFNNARNMPLSPRDYLLVVAGRKKISRQETSHTARDSIEARSDPPH